MNPSLFKLALDRLEPSQWDLFEKLSSSFLAMEFNQLRTMANPSGDGGRDSELFQADGMPFICFQYSVRKDWKNKILQTAKRLQETLPEVRILIFLSNKEIGALADELKTSFLGVGLSLDVRDKNWFMERATIGESREHAANMLIEQIALPYLAGESVINKPSSPLTSGEARAALLYLGLQWQDDITEKSLTKLSFDALVRSVLRHTHTDIRISRSEIQQAVLQLLPSTDKQLAIRYIDTALTRLTKKYIRHWPKEDEFCLTHEEHQRILASLAENEIEESKFNEEVMARSQECLTEISGAESTNLSDLTDRIPRVIERLLLKRGEAFVSAILTDKLDRVEFEHLTDIIFQDISDHRPKESSIHHLPVVVSSIVRSLIRYPTESTQHYLRKLANSYTLFSFLKETPDIQSATKKLFSHGTIWLDTTVLLPVFAELLEEDETQRRFSQLFKACHEVGIQLRVTPGVVNEINSHMNRALAFQRSDSWHGRTPFLYCQYIKAGNPTNGFSNWLSLFRGTERPEDDIPQFLEDIFGIMKVALSDEAMLVDDNLRWAVERLWTEAHNERRKNDEKLDGNISRQLISHDVENYLGVISLRQKEQVSELGYKNWLLTLDKNAWQIRDRLRDEFTSNTPPSPLLSLDYLVNNITFGPERRHLSRSEEQRLPILLDIEMSESMPHDILEIAEKVRHENEGLPEYVIKRKVRDAIDKYRRSRIYSGENLFYSDHAEELT